MSGPMRMKWGYCGAHCHRFLPNVPGLWEMLIYFGEQR